LRIYTALDKDVTPPVPTSQRLPQWPSGLMTFLPAATGLLELVIDETGRVESVALRQSLNRIYDALLVEAAKAWRYKPAVKEGQPVKFRKLVEIVSPVRPAAREGGWVS
jgi:TonB family protein